MKQIICYIAVAVAMCLPKQSTAQVVIIDDRPVNVKKVVIVRDVDNDNFRNASYSGYKSDFKMKRCGCSRCANDNWSHKTSSNYSGYKSDCGRCRRKCDDCGRKSEKSFSGYSPVKVTITTVPSVLPNSVNLPKCAPKCK